MKSKLKKLVCVLTGCLVLSGSLSSCQGVEITGKAEDIPGYTEQEAMIVLGSERNRYQKVLGQEIWSVPVENQPETTYGPYFVNKVKDFLQDIKTLNLEATEKGIIATSTDMETIRKIAKEFYQGLSEEDIAFMGNCTEEDVQSIYTEYYVATKTAEYLLSKVSSEVSDADAKVITVQQIVVSDEASANTLLEAVNVQGANFSYYARTWSEDPEIDKTLAKDEKDDAYYTAAFQLAEGEISDVIEEDGRYYILKCTNAYDKEATAKRKEGLEQTIRASALLKSYQAYADQHIVRFREPFWDSIALTAHPDSTADNFFSLFDENVSF
ncbi:MAG: peptidylprolyl isomerase [Oribacterium sp.]|nr:peptidylprolyl isomerase [Oribacterium sp.]